MLRQRHLALGILFFVLCMWVSDKPIFAYQTNGSTFDEIAQEPEEPVIALPPNFFVRTVASNLSLPTDMVILPSGDLLITQKGLGKAEFGWAEVRLVRDEVLQPTPVLKLSVNVWGDSGLLGIAIDPNFTINHFFYLWYSKGVASLGWNGTTNTRLSRFVLDTVSGKADPASETVILDNVAWSPVHNGGGLVFDNQGNLLITTGDNADVMSPPQNNRAQKLTALSGKVLRIRPRLEGGYDIPSDNPFADQADEGIRPEIYASGLRNPFRIDRRASDQKFYLIEVGENFWEEVNLVAAGANYGWPFREGNCAIFENADACTPDTQDFTAPLMVYPHPEESGAGITAMSFYEGTLWPAEYQGLLFFADFNSQWIGTFNLDAPAESFKQFATSVGYLVDMEATPEGIYMVDIAASSVKFVYYDAEENHPPIAILKSNISTGKAPLQVEFTATATDADDDEVVYSWDFGDGSKLTTVLPSATHVYKQDGDYTATLQVIDHEDGKSGILTELIQVYSGEVASVVQTNLTEPGRVLYHGGDRMLFTPSRTGDKTGLDPIAPYAWAIWMHHHQHNHVQVIEYISDTVTFELPTESHSLDEPLWYGIELSMQTESGQVLHSTLELHPQTTTIQLQSWPGEGFIKINGQERSPTDVTTLVVGEHYTLEAPLSMIDKGGVGKFSHWVVTESLPAANVVGNSEIVFERTYTLVAPAEPTTIIAFYEYTGLAGPSYLPSVAK